MLYFFSTKSIAIAEDIVIIALQYARALCSRSLLLGAGICLLLFTNNVVCCSQELKSHRDFGSGAIVLGSLLSNEEVRGFVGLGSGPFVEMEAAKSEFARIIQEFVKVMQDAATLSDSDRAAFIEKMYATTEASLAAVELRTQKILDEGLPPDQLHRLVKVYVQLYGMVALKNELVANALSLGPDSRRKIVKTIEAVADGSRAAMKAIEDEKDKSLRLRQTAKLQIALDQILEKRLRNCITEAEFQRLNELTGSPLDLAIIVKAKNDRKKTRELAEAEVASRDGAAEASGSQGK